MKERERERDEPGGFYFIILRTHKKRVDSNNTRTLLSQSLHLPCCYYVRYRSRTKNNHSHYHVSYTGITISLQMYCILWYHHSLCDSNHGIGSWSLDPHATNMSNAGKSFHTVFLWFTAYSTVQLSFLRFKFSKYAKILPWHCPSTYI